MDNLEQNAGAQGGEDVTSSQAQPAVEETQPVETEQPVDGGTQEEAGEAPQYPWQAEEKFRDAKPEDIFNSYKEMEKLYSRKAEVANLIEEKFGVTPEQLKTLIAQQEQQKRQERYANNPLAPLLDKVESLEQTIKRQEQEKAYQLHEKEMDNFLKENEVYAPFREELSKLALTPGIGFDPETDEEVPMEELAEKFFGKAIASGQQGAYKKIETKKQTQATTSRSTPQRKITLEEMEKMSAAELRAILPHAPRE